MNTKRRILGKMVRFVGITLILIGTQSCETDIPITDREPPKFSFQVTGDGLNHTFDQDTNFSSVTLMLRRGVTYNFIFTGSDQGGMDRMAWYTYHSGRVSIETTAESPWRFRNDDQWNSSLRWLGNRNNPLTGSAAAGTFTTQGSGNHVNFRFSLADFGGETGSPNNTWKDLQVYVGAHNSRVRY